MNEKQENFVQLRDSRLKNERLLEDKKLFEKKGSEMHPDDINLKLRSIEIEILKTRGDIYKLEETLGLNKNDPEVKKIEEEAFKEIDELEKELEGRIPSQTQEERDFFKEIDKIINELNSISGKISQKGYSIQQFENLSNSEKIEETDFYKEITDTLEESNLNQRLETIKEKNPSLLLDLLIPQIKDSDFRSSLLGGLSDNKDIPHPKIIDSFIKNIYKDKNSENFKSLENSIDVRLIEEKRKAVLNLPAEKAMDIILEDPELYSSAIEQELSQKCKSTIEQYMASKDLSSIKILLNKIISLKEKNNSISFASYVPLISQNLYFKDDIMIAIFSGDMPKEIFDDYFNQIVSGPFLNLVPEKLLKDKSLSKDINISDFLTVESIKDLLIRKDITFSDLSVKNKLLVLKLNKEAVIFFSKDDFLQMLHEGYLDLNLIPKQYYSELKQSLIENLFNTGNLNIQNFERYSKEVGFDTKDLTDEQKITFINLAGSNSISLFVPEELKQLVLIKNIEGLKINCIREILKVTGLTMKDFSIDRKLIILNNSVDEGVYEDFYDMFDPSDLKSLILNKGFKLENVYNTERFFNLLNITGTTIHEFSTENKLIIFNKINYRRDKILEMYNVEDIREIISVDKKIVRYLFDDYIPQEYLNALSNELIEAVIDTKVLSFIENKQKREWFFEKLKEKTQKNENQEILNIKDKNLQRINRMQESFWLLDSQEKLPAQIIEKFNNFKEKYGKKGEGLMSLSIIAFGLENTEQTISEIEKIENLLDLYNKEKIPEGMRVTEGIEYEVGNFTGEIYNKESILGYEIESQLIGMSSRIKRGGAGTGSIYEHATTPTDNPYILMAEVELLQKIELIDFNFKKYENASRGYHLNLGGETGLCLSEDMYFLDNVMSVTGLNGLKLGQEVSSVKSLYKKNLEAVFEKTQGGDRVEMKGMGCDSIEQFNKAILTAHHAGIAVQTIEKYSSNISSLELLEKLPDNIEDMESFFSENDISFKGFFDSEQEKQIIFNWLEFKKEMLLAVRQHNNSFANSEFRGFLKNEKGEYVDTGDNIDVVTNKRFLEEDAHIDINSEQFKKYFSIPEEALIGNNLKLVNSLTRVNNLFIFKEPILSESKFYIDEKTGLKHLLPVHMSNAYSALTRMKGEGYVKEVAGSPFDSIIDLNGKMRDGYYPIQGASEEMITHKSQILLNRFNKKMEELLCNSTEKELENKKEQYERAI